MGWHCMPFSGSVWLKRADVLGPDLSGPVCWTLFQQFTNLLNLLRFTEWQQTDQQEEKCQPQLVSHLFPLSHLVWAKLYENEQQIFSHYTSRNFLSRINLYIQINDQGQNKQLGKKVIQWPTFCFPACLSSTAWYLLLQRIFFVCQFLSEAKDQSF